MHCRRKRVRAMIFPRLPLAEARKVHLRIAHTSDAGDTNNRGRPSPRREAVAMYYRMFLVSFSPPFRNDL